MATHRAFPTIPIAEIPRKIVLVSRDQALLKTRMLILAEQGYSCVALMNDAAADGFLFAEPRPPVSLVLLCHSVPEASRVAICRSLKRFYPEAPIVAMFAGFGSTECLADAIAQNVHSPEELIAVVERYATNGERRKKPRALASRRTH